jgi:hypothetical protein
LVLILAFALEARKRDQDPTANFPRVLLNARFVYVTSFSGGQFNISPEDRAAIETAQEALEKWGRYTLVYQPENADLVFNVRAGREVEARVGVRVNAGSPPPHTSVGEMAAVEVGPPDDYVEILMPARRSGVKRAIILWDRMRHNGLEDGAPLIQEFRKEAEAAAAHDAQSKNKP